MLALFPGVLPADNVHWLGSAGGFSGAQLWQLSSRRKRLCLRAWPTEFQDEDRLRWMHDLLSFVAEHQGEFVPRPWPTEDGRTAVQWDGRFWELSLWLPGTADYHQRPSRARLESAMHLLVKFHQGANSWLRQTAGGPDASPDACSPGVQQRLSLLSEFRHETVPQLLRHVQLDCPPELAQRAESILRGFQKHSDPLEAVLRRAAAVPVPVGICHGDLWHDHVLFEQQRVSGLVDFGAMKIESRTADLARLLGSLVADDRALWSLAIDAYARVDALSDQELGLMAAFDRSAVVLSGLNWLRWILIEKRNFGPLDRIGHRLDTILERLRRLDHSDG